MNILPRADEAVIPFEKFTKYALNPDGDANKAEAFLMALEYDLTNYEMLIEDIKLNITNYNAVPKPDLGHGQRYEIIMELTGPNGKTANVLTAWIDDKETGEMRLINAYIDRKKGGTGND
ncbi:MAG: hypothetical protein LBM98_02185 [Oscillospiraceae bacterium]|jgi:hypothetical protein|nr:hypothetical protein [Oscillospiraceae bacterium]